MEAEVLEADFTGQRFCYKGEEYTLSLAGSYQTENAVLALEALRILDERGYHTTTEQRREGLKATHWNGRLTIIHRDPLFIVDGAHNPAAADMLEDSVRKYFKDRRLFFIMGVFKDKDYPYIIPGFFRSCIRLPLLHSLEQYIQMQSHISWHRHRSV